MRDIRDDINERIRVAKAKRERALADLKEAEAEEAGLREMLAIENRRYTNPERRRLSADNFREASPISDFLTNELSDGKPRSLALLASKADRQGLKEEGKSLKRSINAVLMGWQNRGLAEKDEHARWTLKKQETPSA